MKKLLTATALATMVATTAQADMSNTVNYAKAERYAGVVATIMVYSKACNDMDTYIALLEDTRNQLGKAFARDGFLYEVDMALIDGVIQEATFNEEMGKNRKFFRFIKANPDHKDSVEICATAKDQVIKMTSK